MQSSLDVDASSETLFPITIKITLETADELVALWHRFNMAPPLRYLDAEVTAKVNDMHGVSYETFKQIDDVVSALGLVE